MGEYVEKRRLFLQSYHFSRKKSASEKLGQSAVRARRLVWVRLRAAKRVPKLLWLRVRCAWNRCRWRRFFRVRRLFAGYRPIVCNRDGSC